MQDLNGTVVINSPKAGYDQYGAWVDWGYQQYAVTTGSGSTIQAQYIQVRGGVDIPANYQNIDPNGDNPLFCRAGVAPDPLSALPIPVVTGTAQAPVSVNGGTKVFSPGIYQDIFIGNNSTVTFNPGIYIMSPTQNNQGLRINGNSTITGNSVLFYFTGSDYVNAGQGNGYYDVLDGAVEGRAQRIDVIQAIGLVQAGVNQDHVAGLRLALVDFVPVAESGAVVGGVQANE